MYLALIHIITRHPVEFQDWLAEALRDDISKFLPKEHRDNALRRLDVAADTLTMIVDELRKQADASE